MNVRQRFIAKRRTVGHQLIWGVYDTVRASWPVQLPDIGDIPQHLETEAHAEQWADALEKYFNA